MQGCYKVMQWNLSRDRLKAKSSSRYCLVHEDRPISDVSSMIVPPTDSWMALAHLSVRILEASSSMSS